MKLNKLAAMAVVSIFALGIAKAGGIANFEFEKLDFTLTAMQQDQDQVQTSPNVLTSTISTFRINSKNILDLMATALGTTWPTGARLALDNNSMDIFVVDKTGSNALYNATLGFNQGGSNVLFFTLSTDDQVFRGKQVSSTSSLHISETDFGKATFHLFIVSNSITTTDLSLDGVDTSNSTFNENNNGNSLSTHDNEPLSGDGVYGDGTWTVVKGMVVGSGKWKNIPVP